jgi:four helix bundle protein
VSLLGRTRPPSTAQLCPHYRDLIAWKKAIALGEFVYQLTDSFPKREVFGLSAQIRRAVVSISANIAEGNGRLTRGEWQQFLGHARGSHLELETELTISWRVGLITQEQHGAALARCDEVGRLINGLLKASANRPTRKPFD